MQETYRKELKLQSKYSRDYLEALTNKEIIELYEKEFGKDN